MSRPPAIFALPARLLHWSMAGLMLVMLFIGLFMVSTAGGPYPLLLAWHRPIGIAILVLAVLRLIVRFTHRPPPLPEDLPRLQKWGAEGSHWVLYGLMLAMPLIGWAMQSAGGYPIVLWKGMQLPPILPHDIRLYGELRWLHGVLAFAFIGVILLHLAAALFHALVRRDGVFQSMVGSRK